MFTGIIETIGIVKQADLSGTNKSFWISSALSAELKIDQSVSHDGACLTIEEIKDSSYKVTAIPETLQKTNLSLWQPGDKVNLERSLLLNSRMDGHLVQGHVDTMATCTNRQELSGSWELRFSFPEKFSSLIIEKGSICLNGISLTIFDTGLHEFSVGIIPYTFEHTNISGIFPGITVNLEFDMMGKYVQRMASTSFTFNKASLHER